MEAVAKSASDISDHCATIMPPRTAAVRPSRQHRARVAAK